MERIHHPENGLSDFVAISRYARYRPELQRRETWSELVERVRDMHLRGFTPVLDRQPDPDSLREALAQQDHLEVRQGLEDWGSLRREIQEAFRLVEEKAILPSMRSLQFGGQAIEASHARMYNCSYSFANRPRFFSEAFFLLLSGVGVGFSVQYRHINQLPPIPSHPPPAAPETFTIPDHIEGWARSVDRLIHAYLENRRIEFDYSQIRPEGAPLKTSGGRAPGPEPLRQALHAVEQILQGAIGRRLRPIEIYDIIMHLSRAVLSGGVRRSASICLFSPDDTEMARAKTGNWFEENPQRAFSNNSAVLDRQRVTKELFLQLFEQQKQFGEPGFYFTADPNYGTNPCAEIGLFPQLTVNDDESAALQAYGEEGPIRTGDTLYGWQMCNLSTINGKAPASREAFLRACRYAALIGTLQAAYTDIPYLGPVSRVINEREALLGVSICGILDNPRLLLEPDLLHAGAAMVKATNALAARLIGIRSASRTTCVKPEGTASLILNTGAGIHPHYARCYFRRVQVERRDPVYQLFKQYNPHMTEPSVYNPDRDEVVTFPVEAPPGALCQNDLTALELLEKVRLVYQHWIRPGRATDRFAPGLHHNVSHTVAVNADEWDAVAEYIWKHRDMLSGTALIPRHGDKIYAQAPHEEVRTEADIRKWNGLRYARVDYTQLREETDINRWRELAACSGISCRTTQL